ncbi:winged helix-turn-helix domain-containing protein [uncultured Anaerococcus sp.]|uniref:winged helix-turn-helix domain-containing protein n=1 Tax=uncultured Anaerococcus sp. TaxID=293428 RepID=UPI00260B7068|nr:winged helix-turn-helix domain-containing protein [uncultured Anaerococcus sp.]
MRIASVENENGVSSLINSHFDKKEVLVDRIESIDDLLFSDLSGYDLILVDMTHNKCLQVIQFIKQKTKIPVIYLTERYKKNPLEQEIDDKDFIIHSLTREEFVKDIFNKVEELREANIISLGICSLEEDNGIFRIGNDILDLTKSEIAICSILIKNMGRVLSKDEIVDKMNDRGIQTTERSVREYIRKIRTQFKKAKTDPIKTVSRQGYQWILDKCENDSK